VDREKVQEVMWLY